MLSAKLPAAVLGLAGRAWHATPEALRRRFVRAVHPAFLVAVIGLVRDSDNRLLFLEHRFYAPYPWSLPSGFLRHNEALADGLAREVLEETGLMIDVEPAIVDVSLESDKPCVAVALRARARIGSSLRVEPSLEIVSGRFMAPSELPNDVTPEARRLAERFWRAEQAPGH